MGAIRSNAKKTAVEIRDKVFPLFLLFVFLLCTKISPAQIVSFAPPWDAHYTVDAVYKNYLSNSNGRYIFILNKTAWAYFACTNPAGYLKKAQKEGITTIRVALEGTPYYDVLDWDMWPWGGTRNNPDYTTINVKYWDEVEKRIRLAGDMGFGIDLCLYTGLIFDKSMINSQKKYWETVIERLAKYTNILTWEIHNEYLKNEEFQATAAKFLKESDPYKRPVCSSDGTTDNAAGVHFEWMDLAIVHTCTGSTPLKINNLTMLNADGGSHHLKDWYQSIARNVRSHNKPAFNNESGRERRHGNDDPVHRRKQGWIFNASGCFWTHHSWDGCEGIDDMEYKAPGSEFLLSMRQFFESIPFWTLIPDYTVVRNHNPNLLFSTMSDSQRKHTISYICTLLTGEKNFSETLQLRLPAGQYCVTFISPISLETIKKTYITSKSLGLDININIPDFMDDILMHITLII